MTARINGIATVALRLPRNDNLDNYFMFKLTINFIIAFLIYLNLQTGGWVVWGVFLALFWLLVNSKTTAKILKKIFPISSGINRMLGLFLSIWLLGFIANIFASWLILDNMAIFLSLMAVPAILYFWQGIFNDVKNKDELTATIRDWYLNFKKILSIIFGVLLIIGWKLIGQAKTGEYIMSPWEVLSFWFLVVVFLLGLLVYVLIYSKRKVFTVLFLIILLSLLAHSYLLVYQQGFGGDRWRHIGAENRIMAEIEFQPTLVTQNLKYYEIGSLKVPQALVAVRKLSYGFHWSLSVIISKIIKLNVLTLDNYLILILWSVFLPLLLYAVAKTIWPHHQYSLMVAALPLVFYLFQYYGALTLSISYSVMYVVFMLGLWLVYIKSPNKKLLAFNIFLTLLMYFGYSLALIVAIVLLVFALFYNLGKIWRRAIGVTLSLVIFVIEWASSYNYWRTDFLWAQIIKDLTISSNWLFFGSGRAVIWSWNWTSIMALAVSIVFGFMFLYFVRQIIRQKDKMLNFVVGFWAILLANYLLSWILLDGLHTLTRRINVFILIPMIFIFGWGIVYNIRSKKSAKLVALALTIVMTLAYISGPVLNAMVTTDELVAMEYVWEQIKASPSEYCVVANTWPLLALDGLSAKQVVAGNFPSDFNHQQPERVEIYDKLIIEPELEDIQNMFEATGASLCVVAISRDQLSEKVRGELYGLMGEPKNVANILIWTIKNN